MWYSLVDLQLTGEKEVLAKVKTDAHSPWFDGHFPGDPTLPAIGQLDMISHVIGWLLGDEFSMSGLGRVKFRRRVQPGELLKIQAVAGKSENTYSFRMTTGDDELVSSGVMKFALRKERE